MKPLEFEPGYITGKALCDALGIRTSVQRIIIDCQVDGVCKVYVQAAPTKEETARLVETLQNRHLKIEQIESASVDADGFVSVTLNQPAE